MTDRRDRLPARQSPSTSRRKESGGRSRQETLPPATASAVPQRLRGGRVRCAIYPRRSSEEGLEQEFNLKTAVIALILNSVDMDPIRWRP